MSPARGSAPLASNTAPAGSREIESQVMPGPRIVAREFARLFAEHEIAVHPAEIRQLASRFCADGRPFYDVETLAIAYADPTGERAVANVKCERGY